MFAIVIIKKILSLINLNGCHPKRELIIIRNVTKIGTHDGFKSPVRRGSRILGSRCGRSGLWPGQKL